MQIALKPVSIPKLRRELSQRHLTLFAISAVIGTRPIAQAAHAGPTSVALWIAAAFGVLMPLAIACAVLTARSPSSGGLYQWARKDFGPWHGFLCFWVYWVGIALIAVLIIGNAVGQFGSCGTAVSRLPLAAGVDHLLPSVFARVHPGQP